MKNKIILFLLVLFLTISCYEIYKIFNVKKIENIEIEKIEELKISDEKLKENKQTQEELILTKPYLGYIEIEKLGIKKLISYGTTDDVLNKNVVGLHKASILLDDPYGNIILAGHNNKYVFANLLKIKINDEIKITSYIKTYTFKVFKIDIVELDNYDYFKSYDDSKILTLITCYSKNKRFIVLGKVIN